MEEGRQGAVPLTSRSSRRNFEVVLAGYFGFGNLGDELLASASIDFLVESGVDRNKIAILSADPDGSEKKFGVKAFDRWSLRTVSSVLSSADSMLFAGGGLFQDSTSIRSIIYYWGLSLMASCYSCKPWAVGQSVGPLRSAVSKILTRSAFRRCVHISARDESSQRLLAEQGLVSSLMPDIVLGLKPHYVETFPDGPVMINIRPIGKSGTGCKAVAAVARKLHSEGVKLKGIALSLDDADEFARSIADLSIPEMEINIIESVEDFSRHANGCAAAVGMRLHFGVLCYSSGVKCLLCPYDPKVSAFAGAYGLPLLADGIVPESFDIIKLLKNDINDVKREKYDFHKKIKEEFSLALAKVRGECP